MGGANEGEEGHERELINDATALGLDFDKNE
jgi:hypothetical protein